MSNIIHNQYNQATEYILPLLTVQALHKFEGQREGELCFELGDIIEVFEYSDRDWWQGRVLRTNMVGLFPACLVSLIGNTDIIQQIQDSVNTEQYDNHQELNLEEILLSFADDSRNMPQTPTDYFSQPNSLPAQSRASKPLPNPTLSRSNSSINRPLPKLPTKRYTIKERPSSCMSHVQNNDYYTAHYESIELENNYQSTNLQSETKCNLDEADTNLSNLIADISLQINGNSDITNNADRDVFSHSQDYIRVQSKPEKSIPKPPPRLSREAALSRINSVSENTSSLMLNKSFASVASPASNQPSILNVKLLDGALPSSILSPLSEKETEFTPKINKKKIENKVTIKKRKTVTKPKSLIQLVQSSNPVADADSDGFDFDENAFYEIDNYIKQINLLNRSTPLEELVKTHLCGPYEEKWQKIRAIFTWIVSNINYELGYTQEINPILDSEDEEEEEIIYDESAQTVYNNRTCRKHGFANLFHHMCKIAEIEVEIVMGHLKDVNNEINYKEVNHSWIAVKIQGYHRFIDPGFASASHPQNYSREVDTFYFLTNPAKLIYTHYPSEESQQYLDPPISSINYECLPYVSSSWFDYKLSILDLLPDAPLIINDDETKTIDVSIPQDVQLDYNAHLEIIDNTQPSWKKQRVLIQVKEVDDRKILRLFVRIKGNSVTGVLKFFTSISSNKKSLPLAFGLWIKHEGTKQAENFVQILENKNEFYIVEPLNFDLLYNTSYRFHLTTTSNQHYKLALRSPTMKTNKFVFYPAGEMGYVANVTLRERGQWAISYFLDSALVKSGKKNKKDPWINVACYNCI